jgi:hypothetical protein
MLGVLLIAGSESDFLSNILMQFIMLMRPDPMRFDIQSINTLKQMMMLLESCLHQRDIGTDSSHWRGHVMGVPKPMIIPRRVACINERSALKTPSLTGKITPRVNESRHTTKRDDPFQRETDIGDGFSQWQSHNSHVRKLMMLPQTTSRPRRDRFKPWNHHHQPPLSPSRRACTPSSTPPHT